jgi:hypothetical protein
MRLTYALADLAIDCVGALGIMVVLIVVFS